MLLPQSTFLIDPAVAPFTPPSNAGAVLMP